MDDLPPPLFAPPRAVPTVPATVVRKHSWLGICSFLFSLAGGCVMMLIFGVAAFIEASTPGGIDEESASAVLMGLLMFAVLALHLVGIGLAIGGLTQQERKKVLSVLGLIFNSLVILVTLVLLVIGNATE